MKRTVAAINPLPPLARLRKVLTYDKLTGDLIWRKRIPSKKMRGKKAGTLTKEGYWQVQIDGIFYLAHRIAWKLATGNDPVAEIDHKNRNRSDNRLDNLREATHSENACNSARFDHIYGIPA